MGIVDVYIEAIFEEDTERAGYIFQFIVTEEQRKKFFYGDNLPNNIFRRIAKLIEERLHVEYPGHVKEIAIIPNERFIDKDTGELLDYARYITVIDISHEDL